MQSTDFTKTVENLNKQINTVNSTLSNYAQAMKQNPVLLQRQMEIRKKQLAKVIPKPKVVTAAVKDALDEVEKIEQSKNTLKAVKKEDYSITDLWGDPRFNPFFLKVADYFGVTEKDYRNAYSKINTIVNWAANATKSRDIADIISKIGKVSRTLQSPAYSEKRYTIMYRYVRLADEAQDVGSRDKEKVEKEMGAYKS